MKLASFEAIVRARNTAGVRYLIAGGLAVNAHGYVRFTKDVDIVIALDADNIVDAFRPGCRFTTQEATAPLWRRVPVLKAPRRIPPPTQGPFRALPRKWWRLKLPAA